MPAAGRKGARARGVPAALLAKAAAMPVDRSGRGPWRPAPDHSFCFCSFFPLFSFCRTGGALYDRRRPCFAIHKFCFKLMKQNFVIFRKTPTKTRYRQIARFLFGVFLAAAYFRAHLYQNAAASPFLREPQVCGKWGALTERRGFRTRSNDLCSSHDLF